MDLDSRYKELCTLAHQRMLEKQEIAELADLATQLDQPNPLAPTLAFVYTKIAILNPQNQVLVIWRSPQSPTPGRADFPGGGLDFGEHPTDGAKREAMEEVGLTLESIELATIANLVHRNRYQLMFGYLAHTDNQSITLSWEHDHYAWLVIPQVLKLEDLPASHKQIVEKLTPA